MRPEDASATPPPAWLRGLFAVLPTPMAADGSVDPDSLDRVVDHYLDGGARGLVPASLAGEGDLLDDAERRLVIQRVAARAGARAPLVVAVLADEIGAALEQARVAAACGARGLLVKPPRGGARATFAHVGAIAHAHRLPIVLLDHPGFGGALPVSLVLALVDAVPEVCGIKVEDEPAAEKMTRLAVLLRRRLRLFGGRGAVDCLRELEHGADGFFTGHPHPGHVVAAIERFRRGDHAGAAAAQASVLATAAREREHPAAMIAQRKAILQELGVIRDAAVRRRPGVRTERACRAFLAWAGPNSLADAGRSILAP